MKKITTLFGALALLFSSSSVFAFEGFSIGMIYGDTEFTTKGKEFDVKGVGGATAEVTTGTAPVKQEDVYSYFLEYTTGQGTTIGIEQIPDSAVVGTKSRTLDPRANTDDDSGTTTAKGEVSDHTTYYVEPTIMLSEGFGVYLKGGAANVTVATKETMATNSAYGDQDVWGVMQGFGAKAYRGNLFVKLEYVETEYGKVTLQSTAGNKNVIEADIDSEATRLAIGYNF
mgnify:CR=1 FL=1